MSSEQIFKMKRFIPLILGILLFSFPVMIVSHSCANTTESPSGGDKDTIPPFIVDIKPLPGATNIALEGSSFIFTFNEYVNLKKSSNILLSPPQRKMPVSKIRGKSLIVKFEEPLSPNTTYTLSFTDAIADVNEGNMFAGYTYVFSTGDRIDSMMVTGTVLDCNTLDPVKGAKVILHKDHSDSAIYRTRPYAVTTTDDWGFFALPYIQDTLYRLYAIKDANNNNLLDPETELVGFVDSLIRPVMTAGDTVKEMLRYDMLDTLSCLARNSEYELRLFRERTGKQFLRNKERTSERSAYITFMAENAIIDTIAIDGYRASQIITQFNIKNDSLEIWLNSRKAFPDTMKLNVRYLKTDSTGTLSPVTENVKLPLATEKRTFSKTPRKNLTKQDTTCVVNVTAESKTIEQEGVAFEFKYPIISENFSDIKFMSINPRQVETQEAYSITRDSLNLRRYILTPKTTLKQGYEYRIKVPHHAFRDINGYYSDSLEVKVSLPSDDKLSTIHFVLNGVHHRYIVELLNEKRDRVLRTYVIDNDCTLDFPYLDKGKYSLRITEDANGNSIVDAGSVLEHRQPEKVKFFESDGKKYIEIPQSAELTQTVNVQAMFSK